MKVKGSITIYLSMILISVMLLVNVIGESARISAVQAQIKSYTYMSAESALAGYGRQVMKIMEYYLYGKSRLLSR